MYHSNTGRGRYPSIIWRVWQPCHLPPDCGYWGGAYVDRVDHRWTRPVYIGPIMARFTPIVPSLLVFPTAAFAGLYVFLFEFHFRSQADYIVIAPNDSGHCLCESTDRQGLQTVSVPGFHKPNLPSSDRFVLRPVVYSAIGLTASPNRGAVCEVPCPLDKEIGGIMTAAFPILPSESSSEFRPLFVLCWNCGSPGGPASGCRFPYECSNGPV